MVPTALKMVYSQMTRSPQAPISVVTVGLMVLPQAADGAAGGFHHAAYPLELTDSQTRVTPAAITAS